jgi:SsrA-binding protein
MKISSNKKARYEYDIIDKYEAGIVLSGSEVKSIRSRQVSLQDSFCKIENNELYVHNMHIADYAFTKYYRSDSKRKRKLLMHSNEIKKIAVKTIQRGLVLVPIEIYFNERGICKLQVALGKSRKKYDKRELIKKRDLDREQQNI